VKECIVSDKAPSAVGPYSHAVKCGQLVFTSGQIALDPVSGTMVENEISAQTGQCLRNVESVLQAAGCSLVDVIKTTIFLTNMADFEIVNKTYASFFDGDFPARSVVEVSSLPKGALIEIEAVAYKA
jgi:2-iminobutanoate/2-iminopropanoate deaminase